MKKESLRRKIIETLSTIPHVWQAKDTTKLSETLQSIDQFFQLHINENIILKSYQNNTQYQSSSFHFLLYFLPLPNHSFIIQIEKSLFFGAFTGNQYKILHLTCPLSYSEESMMDDVDSLINMKEFKNLSNELNIKSILLRDVTPQTVNVLSKYKNNYNFNICNLKEIPYATCDLQKTLSMTGSQFANIRWHLNKFIKKGHKIEIKDTIESEKALIHLIGKWRRHAIKQRGFSFSDVRSDKFGAKLVSYISNSKTNTNCNNLKFLHLDKCFFRILKINRIVSSFHFGFPLGFSKNSKIFAHAIGITDLTIPHLSEYAQIDFWKYLNNHGVRYVNDGPSWRKSLEIYKMKFRPIQMQRNYWATLSF